MTPESAEALLEALGTKKAGQTGIWMRSPCPLAPWLHKSGKDSNPSFGLLIEEGSAPRFHCFTCETGNLSTLLQTIEYHNQISPGKFYGNLSKAREIVEAAELELPLLPSYSEFGQQKKKVFEEWPSYLLETHVPVFVNQRASAYCGHRGFSLDEQVKHDLRYDKDRDMVVFPYWNVFGKFAGMRGRKISMPEDPPFYGMGHHDYVWNGQNNAGLTFYNEECLNLPGPVVVVEGQTDCIKTIRVWPKTVANMTAKPIMDKVQKLGQTDGVVLLLDGDQPGRDATSKWVHLLNFLNIKVLPIYLPFDPDTGLKSDPDSIGAPWIQNKFEEHGLFS